jgi:CheY-like chemotaxis protein
MFSNAPPIERGRRTVAQPMGATILVVDDNDCIRDLLYLHLAYAGYRVLAAEDAIAAGRLLREQHVDLLLADVEMPLVDGLDLVRALRNDASVSSLPVVFVTSHAKYADRAKELGAVAFLTKPVRTSELFATIAEHLKKRRGEAVGVTG